MKKNLFTFIVLCLCQFGWAQYSKCLVLTDNEDGAIDITDADYLEIGNVETSQETSNPALTNYTVEFWMKPHALFSYGPNFGAENDFTAGLRFRFTSAGNFSWWTAGKDLMISTMTDEEKSTISSCLDGEWVHVALCYEETDPSAKTGTGILYLNGDSILSGAIPTPQDGFKGFRVSTDGSTSVNYLNRRFIGELDEFCIWRTTRNKDQVKVDKSDVIDSTSEGLLIYYNFNEINEGVVINQVNPGKYDATIVKYQGNTSSSYQESDLFNESYLAEPLPQAFTTTVYNETFGDLNLELYKYSIRGEGLKIYTCRQKGEELTLYSDRVDTFEVRTYRGRITNLPNARVFASVYPDKKLYAKVYFGKGERDGFVINGAQMTMTPADIQPIETMYKAHNHIKSGFSPDSAWFAGKNYDVEMAFAVINQAVNGMDYILARDFNLSMELSVYVIPLDDNLFDKNKSPIWTNTFWYTYGSGGSCGRSSLCSGNKGGRTSVEDISFGSFSHEFGHLLDFGHYHNQWDCMHSNMDWYGRDNSVKGRLNINSETNACTISDDNYKDPVHPYAAEDYFITIPDVTTPVDVLANDFDSNPDDILSIKSFQAYTQEGGNVALVDGKLEYTPAPGFVGRDYFSYEVQSGSEADGACLWNNALVFMDVRDQNLALYYSFDESIGSTVVDRGWGISQNNGFIINGTYSQCSTEGKVGNALQLNGIDQCVELQDVVDPLGQSMSVSLWFKLSTVPAAGESMMLYDTGSKGTLTAQGISIVVTEDAIGFYAQPEDLDLSGCHLTKSVNWQTEQWYHAIMVVNREDNILEAYLDKEKLTVTDYTTVFKPDHIIKGYPGKISGLIASALGTESKSASDNISKKLLNGALDEFRIYTKALNADEVAALNVADIVPNSSYPSGLFDNPVLNRGFEANVVKHASMTSGIDHGWYTNGIVKTLWSAYSSVLPLAPEGDNWAVAYNGSELYQQVGFLKSNVTYALEMVLAQMSDEAFSGLKVSLWAGENIQSPSTPFNEDNMTKLAEGTAGADFLNGDAIKQFTCELATGSVVGDCTPLWLRIQCPSDINGAVLLDDVQLYPSNDSPTDINTEGVEGKGLGYIYYQGNNVMLQVLEDNVTIEVFSMQGKVLQQINGNKGPVMITHVFGSDFGIVRLTKEHRSDTYKYLRNRQ